MASRSSVFSGFPYAENQILTLEFWLDSQDLTLNRSYFGYRAYISGSGSTNGGAYTFSGAMSASVSGQSWSWGSNGLVIAQGTFAIDHDAQGQLATQTLKLYVTVTAPTTGSAYVEVPIGVPDIPRGSKITTFDNFYPDSSIPITLEKAVSTFRHTVYLQMWDKDTQAWVTVRKVENVDTSTTITLTTIQQDEIYKRMPDSTVGDVRLFVETFNGSTYMGSTTKGAKAIVRSTLKPTIGGMSFYDTVTASRDIGAFVQGISKIRTTLTGVSGIRYSTVVGTEIWQNGEPGKSDNPATMTKPVILSGNVGILGKVIDSRGQVGERSQTVNVLPYKYPTITELSVTRCDSNGAINPLGLYFKFVVKGKYSSLVVGGAEKNTGTLRFRFAIKGQALVTRSTRTVSPDFEEVLVFGTQPIANEYDVSVEIVDKFATRAATSFVPKGAAPLVIGPVGIGAGVVPTNDVSLDVGHDGARFAGPFKYDELALTLINGTAGGTGDDQPRARRIGSLVFLTGYVVPNVSGGRVVATLPSGYRPVSTEHFAGLNLDTNTPQRFFISTSGNVQIYGTANQRFGISCVFLTT